MFFKNMLLSEVHLFIYVKKSKKRDTAMRRERKREKKEEDMKISSLLNKERTGWLPNGLAFALAREEKRREETPSARLF